jgi:hypothetical protein
LKILIFILAQVGIFIGLFAQSFEQQLYTPFFNQFHQIKLTVNPAMAPFENRATVDLAVQFHPGTFSNFNSTYFSATFGLKNKEKQKVKQLVGLQVKNDSEGKLLNRNFLYGSYALSVPINSKYYISAGIQLGMASINFKSTSITPGSSSHTVDGNVGVQFYSDKFWIGVSYNQFFGSELINLGETSALKSYGTLLLGKEFLVDRQWDIRLNFLHQTDSYHTTALNTELVFNKKMIVVLGWNNRKGTGVGGSLQDLKIGKQSIFLSLTYYIPTFLYSTISTNEFEMLAKLTF